MPLFEVAIIKKPTPKELEEGAIEKLILTPTPVIAKDASIASVIAALQGLEKISQADLAQSEVLVRPFK